MGIGDVKMIMTLFIIIDDENHKKYVCYEHSGWHHLKILSKILKYAQVAIFGQKMYKEEITIKDLMKLMDKNSNGGLEFEEIKDFRALNRLDDCSIDGYVIFRKYVSLDEEFNDIFINTASTEGARGKIIKDLREQLKEMYR